jgi:hypothetical protein
MPLAQHGYKSVIRSVYGEEYNGNISLCGKMYVTEDGDYPQPFEELKNEGVRKHQVCGLCKKIYEKL